MLKKKTQKEREEDQQIKQLASLFEKRGIKVRREKLSRGQSFRVKSGDCVYTEEKVLFLDKRLPSDQQINVLIDYIQDFSIKLEDSELESFPKPIQSMILR